MDFIKSIKKLIFNENDNKNKIKISNKSQNKPNDDYPMEYYKYIFKSNYKSKKLKEKKDESLVKIIKPKEQINLNMKNKVNKRDKNENIICDTNSNILSNKNEKIIKIPELSPIKNRNFELYLENYNPNISFFYILKGAVLIIEEWWKIILIKKNKNKIVIKRCINNKNNKLFSKNYCDISKTHINSIIDKKYLKTNNRVNRKKNNLIDIEKHKQYKINPFKSSNSLNIKPKKNIFEKIENIKESFMEETVANFDSVFYEFDEKENYQSKEKEKIKKIMKFDEEIRNRKIYSSNKINNNRKRLIKENHRNYKDICDAIETKRESSIIYPINEIEHIVIEDIFKNIDKKVKKSIEKGKIKDYCNISKSKRIKTKNQINKINNNNDSTEKKFQIEKGKKKIEIPWEDLNNNMTPFISIEQNRELFDEIKSKIKIDLKKINDERESEISILQNKYLLRENPLNESSIYIKNSDIKQNEFIRNVNIHIIPTKTKDVIKLNNINDKNMLLNNSNNSNTIIPIDDEDESYTNIIDISDCKNDGHSSSFFNSINKNEDSNLEKKINCEKAKKPEKVYISNKLSKKKFENIYKN
jgi:hypothetical protein